MVASGTDWTWWQTLLHYNPLIQTFLTAAVTIVVGFLGFKFNRRLQEFLAKEKAKHHTELERLKAELERAKAEHQIVFRKLHEKRAEVVAETYKRMRLYLANVNDYTSEVTFEGDPPLEEKRRKMEEAGREFRLYYFPNEIYFPEEIAEEVRDFEQKVFKIAREWHVTQEVPERQELTTREAWERWEKRGEPLREELEPQFRKLRELFQQL
jgi:uncharacterized membrane-anchored protein YhcB (DUF1043 family)